MELIIFDLEILQKFDVTQKTLLTGSGKPPRIIVFLLVYTLFSAVLCGIVLP